MPRPNGSGIQNVLVSWSAHPLEIDMRGAISTSTHRNHAKSDLVDRKSLRHNMGYIEWNPSKIPNQSIGP